MELNENLVSENIKRYRNIDAKFAELTTSFFFVYFAINSS